MAVFVALGTGLLVGSALPVAETMGRKQMAVVEDLRREFGSLRVREVSLRARVQQLEEQVRLEGRLAERIMPGLVRGRLAGARVFLLVSGRAPVQEVEETLVLAGATVVGRRFIPGRATGRSESAHTGKGTPAAGSGSAPGAYGPAPGGDGSVAGGVGPVVTGEGASPAEDGSPPSALAWDLGLPAAATGSGSGGGLGEGAVRLLLLVGDGPPAMAAETVAGLVEEARRRGLPLVAAETSGTRPSLAPLWRRLDVPSVDDADVPAGRLALVSLLAGERGHYGAKPSADAFLPGPWEAGT